MPCYSDGMEQTSLERAIQEAAQVFALVYKLRGEFVPENILYANQCYPRDVRVIPALCAYLEGLPVDERDGLLYQDARNVDRRRIATWWERHQKVDRAREEEEEADDERKAFRESGRAKLTADELRALDLEDE